MIDPSSPPKLFTRRKADDRTTPKALKVRFTELQKEKLDRLATARACSVAQVIRDLVDLAALRS